MVRGQKPPSKLGSGRCPLALDRAVQRYAARVASPCAARTAWPSDRRLNRRALLFTKRCLTRSVHHTLDIDTRANTRVKCGDHNAAAAIIKECKRTTLPSPRVVIGLELDVPNAAHRAIRSRLKFG